MKKAFFWLPFIIGLTILGSPSQAATITYSLDTSFPGADKTDPDGSGPWLTANFDDGGSSDSVLLTLTANLTNDNFVGEWYFNFDPDLDPTQLSFQAQGYDPYGASISTGFNAFKADGDGEFDIKFAFPNKPASRFDGSDSITYQLTYNGTGDMVASSFDFLSVSGGDQGIWFTAAHIQGLNEGGGTWIGCPLPVPSTMFLLGSALIGLMGIRRRYSR